MLTGGSNRACLWRGGAPAPIHLDRTSVYSVSWPVQCSRERRRDAKRLSFSFSMLQNVLELCNRLVLNQ